MAIWSADSVLTAMGFYRLITKMGLYDTWYPLIIPSIASPAVFYLMYSYLQSSLPLSLVEAADPTAQANSGRLTVLCCRL